MIRLRGGKTCYQLYNQFPTFGTRTASFFRAGMFYDSRNKISLKKSLDKHTSNALLQASAANQMKPAFFWDIRQRIVVIPNRRFGTTYRSHLQGSRQTLTPDTTYLRGAYRLSSSVSWPFKVGPTGYHKSSGMNCRYTLPNVPEERTSADLTLQIFAA